jgi:lipoate-protein ligase B
VVEHEPVITLGRNAQTGNILLSRELLAARGVDVVEVERGGDVTYHGPGQLVVYPIRKLPRFREVVPFVSSLERAVIAALATFGIAAAGRKEHRGVYVGDDAICAVGLAVQKMTSLHGLALNADTALDYDRLITPCGTPEFGITSISRELGRGVTWAEARDALLPALAAEFDLTFETANATVPALAASR